MSDSGSGRSTPSGWKRPANTGPRIGRLGDAPTPPSSSSGGRRIATLRDLGSGGPAMGGHGHGGHAHDDDDDDDEDERDPQTFFAGGGERSGVSIQGPPGRGGAVPGGDVVRDLLRRAAEAGPPREPSPRQSNVFSGGGHVLGGEDVESRYVPDPTAPSEDPEDIPTAIRRITFWREGFSVDQDDVVGELRRYDDPENAQYLREINEGRAPPAILSILPGQPVELRISKRTHEPYVAPAGAASHRAFAGAGHRLGSPVPSAVPASSAGPAPSSAMPGGFPPSASAAPQGTAEPRAPGSGTQFEVDGTRPTTRVQVRLADGSRLTARMNLHHRVRDIRGFVDASGNAGRPYTLNTAHPTVKPIEDEEVTIEQAGLANSVVVQRWV